MYYLIGVIYDHIEIKKKKINNENKRELCINNEKCKDCKKKSVTIDFI